jgi:hypothetical protein
MQLQCRFCVVIHLLLVFGFGQTNATASISDLYISLKMCTKIILEDRFCFFISKSITFITKSLSSSTECTSCMLIS